MAIYVVPDYHETVPLKEISSRIKHLKTAIDRLNLDAALFIFPTDVFYLTGTMQNGHLLVPADGAPLFMVRRDLERARAESPLTDISELTSLKQLPGRVEGHIGRSPQNLGLELDVMPVSVFRRYEELWPDACFHDISPSIMNVRSIKSDYEIGHMRKAGVMAHEIYGRYPEFLQEGLTEIEAAGRMTAMAYAVRSSEFPEIQVPSSRKCFPGILSVEKAGESPAPLMPPSEDMVFHRPSRWGPALES